MCSFGKRHNGQSVIANFKRFSAAHENLDIASLLPESVWLERFCGVVFGNDVLILTPRDWRRHEKPGRNIYNAVRLA
jgi:hypothetical protein